MRFVPQGWHPFKNAVVRSSTLMHFSAFLKSFYMVHDKLYYFVFRLIAKSGPEKLVQVLVFMFLIIFLIKLHKTGLGWALCLEIWMTF